MTDFNQKTHDTDVGSHGGQSRQMMEVFENQEFENQEFGSIRLLQEAGKTFFCASDVAKALRQRRKWKSILTSLGNIYRHISVRVSLLPPAEPKKGVASA